MTENRERKRFWNIFYSPLALIVLLVIFLLLARSAWRVYGHEKTSAADRMRVENELALANQRAMLLKTQVDNLKTKQGVDDEIRSKFNVVKENEGVAVIVTGTSGVSTSTIPAEERSWWQKMFDIF